MMGGNKGGQSSMDKSKKQITVPLWRPISTESEHISKIVKSGSSDPIEESINCEKSRLDDESTALAVAFSSKAVNSKSEPVPLKGKETTTFSGKEETFSENHDNATLTKSNEVIRQVKITREIVKFNKDSVIKNEAGKHSVLIQVDAPLIRFVKGKWGLTQKQIEGETGVKILYPSAKDDSFIFIEGASAENVTRASEKITNLLEQAVDSPNLDYSHFISLPLAIHPELVEKLHSFQKSILEEVGLIPEGDMIVSSSNDSSDEKLDDSQLLKDPNVTVRHEVQYNKEHERVNMDADITKLSRSSTLSALGIDNSIFIKPQTFHLTVLMLKLWNKDRVAIATEILKGVSSKLNDAVENRPISIRLRGLACMKGSPAKAGVIYAPVEEVGREGRLLRACQVIIDAFVEAGLVLQKDAHHCLKLHATLMNARHRKRNKWGKRQEYFDARGIFNRYGSEDWGEYGILEAHLSQRFVFDESGYYHCCGSIPFPGSK